MKIDVIGSVQMLPVRTLRPATQTPLARLRG